MIYGPTINVEGTCLQPEISKTIVRIIRKHWKHDAYLEGDTGHVDGDSGRNCFMQIGVLMWTCFLMWALQLRRQCPAPRHCFRMLVSKLNNASWVTAKHKLIVVTGQNA